MREKTRPEFFVGELVSSFFREMLVNVTAVIKYVKQAVNYTEYCIHIDLEED